MIILDNMPYQNQYKLTDPKTKKLWDQGKRNAACAPTSAAMIVHANKINLKTSVNDEAIYLFEKCGTTASKGTVRGNVVKVLHDLYGLTSENITKNIWETIVSEISIYRRPLIFRSASLVGAQGHYVMVIGYDDAKEKKIIVNDPYKGEKYYYSFASAAKNDASVIVAQQVVVAKKQQLQANNYNPQANNYNPQR